MMTSRRRRIIGLLALSSGTVFASGCDVADQVLATIELALRIVDVWV
jgi:hypothetical protein